MKPAISTTHLVAAGVIAGAFAIGFLSGPALAEPQRDASEFAFDYKPSELSSTAKARQMLARLQREARRYCGDTRPMSLAERQIVKACADETVAKAVASLNSATVAEAYRSRAGG
jgi:UrcA family protein